MFTTIRLDLERMPSFDANSGAAKTGEGKTAPGTDRRSPHVPQTAAFQVELSGQFHPQWGYPERLRRVERGAGSTNPEVSWTVVRFEVLDRAGDSR